MDILFWVALPVFTLFLGVALGRLVQVNEVRTLRDRLDHLTDRDSKWRFTKK